MVLVKDLTWRGTWHELCFELALLLAQLTTRLSNIKITLHLELLQLLDMTALNLHQLLLELLNFLIGLRVWVSKCHLVALGLSYVPKSLTKLTLHSIELV